MAPGRVSMTRSASSDSSASSNIDVGPAASTSEAASELMSTDTPPSSVSDRASRHSSKGPGDAADAKLAGTLSRPRLARTSIASYNVAELSRSQRVASAKSKRTSSALTGRTLVNGGDDDDDEDNNNKHHSASPSFGAKVTQALDMDWELPDASPPRRSPTRPQRSASVRDRVAQAAGKVAGKVGSVLGKRSREVIDAGKRRLGLEKETTTTRKERLLRELDMGKRGVLDEIDLDASYAAPPKVAQTSRPSKRVKTTHEQLQEIAVPQITGPLQKTSDGKKVKKWQSEGLYVGQVEGTDPLHLGGQKNVSKKRPSSSLGESSKTSGAASGKSEPFFRLPLFNYLDKTRGFTIPYDVYAPSLRRGDEKPKDWKMLNRNRLVGEARELWEKVDRLPASACVCPTPAPGELGCEDDCLNRVMQYECNEDNCRLAAGVCSNRAFAELQARKEKGGLYDVGVEVLKTDQCGFGVRACRSFAPGQIIMEYTGEIIDEAECQRRMREEYRDKKCYYLMELERNLVIDGTKGSMARFINHSCEPNCEVRMVKVNGTPRMAVFAGDAGIMTGEELSYDYNFDNFGNHQQACHCGARTCRGYLGKRLNAAEQKKQAKLAEERKRKAAEEAQRAAAAEERRKKAKTARGSGWRGWVAVDDDDVKAQLRDEKRRKDEAELSSARALRMAARRRSSDSGRRPAAAARSLQPTRTSPRKNRQSLPQTGVPAAGARFADSIARVAPRQSAAASTTAAKRHSAGAAAGRETTRVNKRAREENEAVDGTEEDDDESSVAANKSKRKSLLSSVSAAVRGSVVPRAGKMKQSTLQFTRAA